MNRQSQLLFEAPLSFETTDITHPYIQYEFNENEWELDETIPTTNPQTPFGQLVVGTRRFSYAFTAEDALWLARFIVGEAGGKDNLDNHAVIWAMFNRYALFTHKVYKQFHKFIRSYSTPLQPILNSAKAAERHIKDPAFVKTGGFYKPPNSHIPKGQLQRYLDLQKTPWNKLPSIARSLAERALKGQIPNPGIGIASEFANTFVYFKQAHKRQPNAQEWRRYTEIHARQKNWTWIGDVPKLNQVRQNAFFVDNRVKKLPSNTVQIRAGAESNRPASAPNPTRPSWIESQPSPYHSSRHGHSITAIIYHFTAGPKLEGTVQYFKNNPKQVSAHYVIGTDGRIVQMVALDRVSNHAGQSVLAGKQGVNSFSIGIEIVNWGALQQKGCPHLFCNHYGKKYSGQSPILARKQYWEPFTNDQYEALIRLTRYILSVTPTITHITGHEDIAIPLGRKNDPGGAFDWNRIRMALQPAFKGHIGPLNKAK
jgi:N-acetyl-anhydromuramyl-L-alanine amidase AmpD